MYRYMDGWLELFRNLLLLHYQNWDSCVNKEFEVTETGLDLESQGQFIL